MFSKVIIYTDGAARGNPGPSGAGWIIRTDAGKVVSEGSRYLGELTNNQAEYRALLLALEDALKQKAKTVEIYCDSELIVRQVQGKYKVKNEGLKPWFDKVRLMLTKFEAHSIAHVMREQNSEADHLANLSIDAHFTSK